MNDGTRVGIVGAARSDGQEAQWNAMRTVLKAQRDGPALGAVDPGAAPLASFGQRRIWFLEHFAPGSVTYCQTIAVRLTGSLSLPALERAIDGILRRHEALRTTLRWAGDELVQEIHPHRPYTLAVDDFRGLDAAAGAVAVESATEREARAPFDLDCSPLLRARLLRQADDAQRLVLTVHHLAFDGWSFDVFMRELCALYAAFIADAPSPLPAPALQYADFAAWQRARLQEVPAHLCAYWHAQLAGELPVLRMPADRPRGSLAHRRGDWLPVTVARPLTERLKALADAEGVTVAMLLHAVLLVLLHRYTGDEDIVVGSPTANRHRAEVEPLIGLFANTLALRTRIPAGATFRAVLSDVRTTILAAYLHQELPFEMLVGTAGRAARTDATPLFQAMFAYQNLPRSRWQLPGIDVDAWNVGNGTAKYDLTLFMWDGPEGFGGLLEYDADLFEAATAAQWLRHYDALLRAIADRPDAPVATLPLLAPDERRQLLLEWNATAVPYPRALPIHRVFAGRVRESPAAVALAFPGGAMSYAALDERANRLARHLQRRGVATGARVGVCLDRSPALVVTLLAILKAGAAYVPVDPAWPVPRIAAVLAHAVAVVSGAALGARLPAGVVVVDIEREADAIAGEAPHDPDVAVDADDLAYVMFTSGSTGAPKGVAIPHRGVVRLVQGANYADITRADVLLQQAPVSFDAATFEIWGALLNGATLALPDAAQPSLEDIGQAIRRHRVSVLWLTTGLFEAMVDARLPDLARVRLLLVGGDVLSAPHAERLLREAPGCRLVNCYGPTENTTFTTFHPVQPADCAPGATVPIGRPVSNSQVYVLDRALQPVPVGVAGEAYAGGDGLMRGYLDDSAATRAGLTPNPFAECPGAWLYRTGDIVRRRRDGVLLFVGRDDEQVKLRGFRVEPGEVQAVLGECPAVHRAFVVVDGSGAQGRRLVAYAVPAAPSRPADDTLREMRDHLRERLPGHLVPADILLVDALPLQASGKVDRARLAAAVTGTRARAAAYVAPRTDEERTIADAFGQVLGVPAVGADDDFFDFGGSSLAALRLVAMLEDRFRLALPLVSLYECPTPALLATRLAAPRRVARLPATPDRPALPLVELKEGRRATPLFLVPGGHGGMAEMTLYARVLAHVAHGEAVYGLLAQGLDGRAPPHASVEAMAAAYIDEIRRLQPQGPYAIAGECVGGLIAFEIAQRLAAAGHGIALLLLLDTWCPTLAGALHYRHVERTATLYAARRAVGRRGLADVRRVLRDHVRDRPPFAPLSSLRYAVNVARTLLRVARPWVAAVNAVGKPLSGAERVAAAEANYVERTMRYRPRRYPGPVTLIVSADNERRGLARPWRALAGGGLTVRAVPGDHESYLRDTPALAARIVDECLAAAAAAAGAGHAPSRRTEDAR